MNQQPKKLYNSQSILSGAFLLFPTAIYFLYHNFKVTDHRRAANTTLLAGLGAIILVIASIVLLSDQTWAAMPRYALPGLFWGVSFVIYHQYQEQIINDAKAKGATFYTWQPAIIIITALVVVIGLFLAWLKYAADQSGVSFEDALMVSASKESQQALRNYQTISDKVFANDQKAFTKFTAAKNASHEAYLAQLNQSLSLYQANKQLLGELGPGTYLPQAAKDERTKLERYTDLRIAMFQLLIKAETEQSNAYNDQITALDKQIGELSGSANQ